MTLGWSIEAAARDSRTKRSRNAGSPRQLRGDQLQRDDALEVELRGAVDDAHPAAPGHAERRGGRRTRPPPAGQPRRGCIARPATRTARARRTPPNSTTRRAPRARAPRSAAGPTARQGHRQHAVVGGRDPSLAGQGIEHRGAQRAAEVGSMVDRVEALEREAPAAGGRTRDAEGVEQRRVVAELDRAVGAVTDRARRDEPAEERDAERAGGVVVAGAGRGPGRRRDLGLRARGGRSRGRAAAAGSRGPGPPACR